jgi:hypothetical protein
VRAAVGTAAHRLLGHDRIGQTHPGKPGILRKRSGLDRDVVRARDLVDRVRHVLVRDVRLIRGVVEDHGLVCVRVIDPPRKRIARRHGARRIVRIAEIDEIDAAIGQRGLEVVFRDARQVDHAGVAGGRIRRAGAPGDHVGVGIHRIDGIHYADHALGGENLLKIGAVALAAVADEDLVRSQRHAARDEILGRDFGAQPLVPDVRPVAFEGLESRHVVGGLVERADDCGRQRPRHVTDAEIDDARGRMRGAERRLPSPDLGEEVGGAQVQVVFIDPSHAGSISRRSIQRAVLARMHSR